MEMITRLEPDDVLAVEKYVSFLLASEGRRRPSASERKEALRRLQRHRGILGGADRDALRESAMEERYGCVS